MNPLFEVRTRRPSPRSVPLCCVLLLSLVAGCSGGVVVHDPIPPPPPPPLYYEGEPNDTAWQAPWFGALFPGEEIWVTGFSNADGSDPQDGLAFTGYGPLRIDFTLFVDDPWTDLDVWLYDPVNGQFLHAYTSAYGDESGTFWIDGAHDFHLIIVPSAGASPWTLGVWASGSTHASSAQAQAPVVLGTEARATIVE
jgi:hypothetical protein